MRKARIKAEGAGYYHCMSRIIEGRFIFGDIEKNKFLTLIWDLAHFGGIDILAYTVMDNICGAR